MDWPDLLDSIHQDDIIRDFVIDDMELPAFTRGICWTMAAKKYKEYKEEQKRLAEKKKRKRLKKTFKKSEKRFKWTVKMETKMEEEQVESESDSSSDEEEEEQSLVDLIQAGECQEAANRFYPFLMNIRMDILEGEEFLND